VTIFNVFFSVDHERATSRQSLKTRRNSTKGETELHSSVSDELWPGRSRNWCSIPGRGKRSFSTVPTPELRPTQSPIEFVPGPFSLGAKRQEREADHSPTFSAKAKNVRALPPLQLRSSLHVAQLIM
jgi:hypothetical protein